MTPSWARRLWWMMCGYQHGLMSMTLRPGYWHTTVWGERGGRWRLLWEKRETAEQWGNHTFTGRLW